MGGEQGGRGRGPIQKYFLPRWDKHRQRRRIIPNKVKTGNSNIACPRKLLTPWTNIFEGVIRTKGRLPDGQHQWGEAGACTLIKIPCVSLLIRVWEPVLERWLRGLAFYQPRFHPYNQCYMAPWALLGVALEHRDKSRITLKKQCENCPGDL